jgi:hypothetical protein
VTEAIGRPEGGPAAAHARQLKNVSKVAFMRGSTMLLLPGIELKTEN